MAIKVNSGLSRGWTRRMDLTSLPATHVDKGSLLGGIFIIVFSLLWGGIPALILARSLVNGDFEPELLFLLIFVVLGMALLLAGFWWMTRRKTIRFDQDNVSVDTRSIFGHRTWTEPLKRYRGVLSRSEYHSGGKNSPSYTLYIVELYHQDRKKRIRLYESRSQEGFRAIWQDYCRCLNMPGLEGEGEKMTERAVEDLDKSVRELAKEGKLTVSFDPEKPPPKGFELRMQDGHLRVGLPQSRVSALMVTGVTLFAGALIYLGFFVLGEPVLGIIGIVVLVVMTLVTIWKQVAQSTMLVAPDHVRLFSRTPWGDTQGVEIRADAIENVRIGRPPDQSHGREGVVLTTSDRCTVVGAGLPADALAWLRDCLLTVITRSSGG